MKRYVLPVLFFASCLIASGKISKDVLNRLEELGIVGQELEIAGVSDDTIKNDDREKIEVLEINTFQNEDDDGEGFRMHVVVELKDKAKNLYIADYTANRPGDMDSEYTGEDYWTLLMPHDDLQQVKITGYAVHFGYMDDEKFILLAEDYDDVKTLNELVERTTNSFPGKLTMKHYYMYEDIDEGVTESISRKLRKIKKKAESE